MKPLIVLVVAFTATALITRGQFTLSGNLAMCLMLCFTALGHFKFTQGMMLMLPSAIPAKKAIIYTSGVAEIALGLALLIPAWRLYTGYILIAFFLLILPANIHAARRHVNIERGTYDGPGLNYLWFRVPLQILFIIWIWFFA
jgi:uncharacterized membrane protein